MSCRYATRTIRAVVGAAILPMLSVMASAGEALPPQEPTAPPAPQPGPVDSLQAGMENAYREGDYPEVIEAGEQRLATGQLLSTQNLELLGLAYMRMGQCQRALETWDRIHTLDPADPEMLTAYYRTMQQAGFADQALPALQQAVALHPDEIELIALYANALENAKRADEGMDLLFPLLSRDLPEDDREQVLYTLRSLALGAERREELFAWLRERAQEQPDNPTFKQDLLQTLDWANSYEEAAQVAETLSALQPEDNETATTLATMYEWSGQYTKAESTLLQASADEETAWREHGFQLLGVYEHLDKINQRDRILAALRREIPKDADEAAGAATIMAAHDHWDALDALIAALEPAQLDQTLTVKTIVAKYARGAGDLDRARRLLRDVILSPWSNQLKEPSDHRELFLPPSGYIARDTSFSFEHMSGDYRLDEAFRQMLALSEPGEFDLIIEELRQQSEALLREPEPDSEMPEQHRVYLQSLSKRGRHNDALEFMQRLWDRGYRDARVLHFEVRLLLNAERFDTAQSRYKSFREENIEINVPDSLTINLRIGNFEAVEEHLATEVRAGRFPVAAADALRHLHRENEHERVARIFTLLDENPPRTPDGLAAVMTTCTGLSMHDAAIAWAERLWNHVVEHDEICVRNSNSSNAFYSQLRDAYRSANRMDDLIAMVEEQLQRDPKSARMHEFLLEATLRSEHANDALARMREFVQAHRDDIDLRVRYTRQLLSRGDDEAAIEACEALLADAPDRLETIYDGLESVTRDDALLECIDAMLIRCAPFLEHTNTLTEIAERSSQRDRHDVAKVFYQRAIEVRPSLVTAHLQLARTLDTLGETGQSVESARVHIVSSRQPLDTYKPKDLDAIVAIFAKAGRAEDLKALAREFAPGDPKRTETEVEAAIARHEGRTNDAFATYQQLYDESPSFRLLDTLIDMARETQDWEASVRLLELQLRLKGETNRDALAEAYLNIGNVDSAVREWAYLARGDESGMALSHVLGRLVGAKLYDHAASLYREMRPAFETNSSARQQALAVFMKAFRDDNQFEELVAEEFPKLDADAARNVLSQFAYPSQPDLAATEGFFNRLLAIAPENPGVMRAYSEFMERAYPQDKEKQLEGRRRWYHAAPEDEAARAAFAESIGARGTAREAFDTLWNWILASPEQPSTLVLAAKVGQTRDYRAVLRMRDELLGLTPSDALLPIAAGLAPAVARVGDVPWAVAVLERLMELAPSKEHYESYLRLLLEFEDYPKAFALYVKYRDEYHQAFLYPERMALACALSGDAESIDRELWRVAPIIANRRYWMGPLAKALAASPGAIEGFQRYQNRVASEPDAKPEYWVVLANLLYEQGDSPRAIEIFSQLCDDYPNNGWYCTRRDEIERVPQAPGEPKPMEFEGQRTASATDIMLNSIDLLVREDRWPVAMAFVDLMKRQGAAGLGLDEAQFKIQLGVALLVVSQYAEAVPLLEEANAAAGDDTWAAPLAIAYAGVGRTEEALELYARTEENLGNAYYLAAALANTRQWEAVLELVSRFSDNQALQRVALIADISIKTGLGEDYRALFHEALATHGLEAVRDFYPRFLKANDLFADAAATVNLRDDPLLAQVLADLFARPDTVREPWRDAVRQALEQSADVDAEATYTFAAALEAFDDLEAAARWYGKAAQHPEQGDDRRREACERILEIGAPEQAHALLAPLVSIHPDLLVHVDDLLSFLLERDGAGLETMAAAWPGDTVPDAAFLQGLIAHALHDDATAGDALMTRALAGELDEDHICVLVDALEYKRALDPLRNLAKALAQRNASARQQRTALRACLVLAHAQQRYDIAARSAAEIFLVDHHYWQVAHGLTVEMTPPQDIPLLRSQLEMLLRGAPNHPRAPHLLILSADLAAAAGEAIDVVALAESLAMPDATTRRTRAWKNMVCTWLVAGPEPLAERDLNMSSELPPNLKASLLPEAYVPPFPRGWRIGELNSVMAQIEFSEALGLDEDATDRMFGYAITEIVSPDARTATFVIGSDAWSYLWLNGDLVHWNYDHRAAIVDQDIVELRLRPGRNRFVAKVGNDTGPWEFSLSILEGGEGLEVALPPPVLPQRDPEMENPATVE